MVSAATCGIGSVAVQLAKGKGATVIGLASETNHGWLRDHGVVPVMYGDGQKARLQKASSGKVDAFGSDYVELALELGVQPEQINTIVDFGAPEKYGVQAKGGADAASAEVLAELADMITEGKLELPIAEVYPLAEVRAAYRELAQGHTRGKIVRES